ncbi:MAG: hypothetical protein QOF98_3561 [Streptomyces sp.]|nr:hypothetical protein [Streptomyces sp.]
MTEGHPSGYSTDYDAYGYDPYSTGAYQTVGTAFADDATGAYAYIPQPAQYQPYDTYDPAQTQAQFEPQAHFEPQAQTQTQAQAQPGYGYGYEAGYDQTGGYALYDPYAYGNPYGYGDATATGATATAPVGTTYYDTGTYDATMWQGEQHAYPQADVQPQAHPQQDWDSGAYPAYGYEYGYGYDASGDTGVYEQLPGYESYPAPEGDVAAAPDPHRFEAEVRYEAETEAVAATAVPGPADDVEPERHDYAADGDADGPVARSRRRKPAKRSALLTVAVPSVAVMGVTAVGAAAVAGVGMAQGSSTTQADDQPTATAANANAPTTELDKQLAGVSEDASDFAERASRSQERIDLQDRQAAAKKAAEAVAAAKEAARPKYVLPVKQKGLSAYFGQAGVNWMALHTGIDFPVEVGTPVMAATDGTVRTQWNSSYGNMAIVTAPDGTETWYCHLSSTKIRSGSVKAGEVIAYSGNTGNTTGPHLHFEVRPGGGAPIDPLPWLLDHGLDPR